jgi:hypothetical protein
VFGTQAQNKKQQQQQHKHTNFFTEVQYRLLPSSKKIVQVPKFLLTPGWILEGRSVYRCGAF